jgi:excisionase family DNA binding protein
MEERFISIKRAAEYCGLSKRFLYEIIAKKELRHYRIHRRIVIDKKDLDDFIQSNVIERIDWDEKARELGR